MQTAMSAESSLANKHCHHEAAAQAAELAELVLAKKQRRHETTTWEKALADDACEQRCQESAKCTVALAKSALAAEQTAVLADLVLPEPALAEAAPGGNCQKTVPFRQRAHYGTGTAARPH